MSKCDLATVTLLCLALVSGLGLRAASLWPKGDTYSHDEIISVLSATGNQARLGDAEATGTAPFGTWVTAASWREFVQMRPDATHHDIAEGLARYDIHPPLYFWLLRAGIDRVGVRPWTGAALNSVIFVLTVMALYGVGVYGGLRPRIAALVSWVWAVSPAVVFTSVLTRQYDLLALMTVLALLTLLLVVGASGGMRVLAYGGLALAVAGGLLTHFYFVVVAGSIALAFFLFRRKLISVRGQWALIPAAVFGAIIALAVFPHAMDVVPEHGGTLSDETSIEALGLRFREVLKGLGMFSTVSHRLATLITSGMIAGIAAVALSRKPRSRFVASWRSMPVQLHFVITAGIILILAWTILFLAFITPLHAFSIRHLSPLWPFVAVIVVAILHYSTPRKAQKLLVLIPLLLIVFWATTMVRGNAPFAPVLNQQVLDGADRVLVDVTSRGHVLRIALRLDPQSTLYVAESEKLQSDPEPWLERVSDGDLYFSSERGRSSRGEILGILTRRFDPQLVSGAPDAPVATYLLREKTSAGGGSRVKRPDLK